MRAHTFAAMGTRTWTVRALLSLAVVLSPASLSAGWQRAEDSKSIVQLDQLTPDQLFSEALDVCIQRARLEASPGEPDDRVTAATAYLNAIYPMARKKSGGKVPKWMIEFSTAHTAAECQHAAVSVPTNTPTAVAVVPTPLPSLVVSEPNATPRSVAKAKRRWKKTPPKRPQSTLEGLPPWLAPR